MVRGVFRVWGGYHGARGGGRLRGTRVHTRIPLTLNLNPKP